jgi:predicted phosphodiesterase
VRKVPQGRRLFRFAVFGDTHIEPETEGPTAPRSNMRSRAVIEAINQTGADLAVHLGDVVHPVPGQPGREQALAVAKAILAELRCPLHVTPGNHDVGDKPLAWMPAKTVRDPWIEDFLRHVAPQPEPIELHGCRLLFLNAPLLNAGTPLEARESARLEAQLSDAAGRVFLFTHYPPFLLSANEPSSYDNMDEPARSWLLDRAAEFEVEALFAGHVHNLFYDRHGETELYIAPSTSFIRRDYSEMFRVEALAENGREDPEKLGLFCVDVFERGHSVRFVPLCGEEEPRRASLGVQLNHPWCETIALPANPPTDPFQRRRARNDYPLWALWRLGIRDLRLPLDDLRDPAARHRLRLLADRGFRLTFFGYGPLDPATSALLDEEAAIIDGFEAIGDLTELPEDRTTLPHVPVLFAPLATSQDALGRTRQLAHFVGWGFEVAALNAARPTLECIRDRFAGFTIHLAWGKEIASALAVAAELGSQLDMRVNATVGLMAATPDGRRDEAELEKRIMEASAAAASHPHVRVFLDTFMDVDRGYYPRRGLIDRRCNLTRLAHAVASREA